MTCRDDKVKCRKDKKQKAKQSTTYLLDDDDIESILDNTESLLDNVEEVLESLDSQLDDSDEGYNHYRFCYMSPLMGKPTICICENKDADQLRGNREADQRLIIIIDFVILAASWENQQSAYAKTKTQISFAVTTKLISAFVFAKRIVYFLFFLNPKFQASSLLL